MMLSAIQDPMELTSPRFSRSRIRWRKGPLDLYSLVDANRSAVVILSAQVETSFIYWTRSLGRKNVWGSGWSTRSANGGGCAVQGFPSGQTQLQATASRHCRPCYAECIFPYIKPVPDLSQRQLIVKRRKFWTPEKTKNSSTCPSLTPEATTT